jgi:hypothetical protein
MYKKVHTWFKFLIFFLGFMSEVVRHENFLSPLTHIEPHITIMTTILRIQTQY